MKENDVQADINPFYARLILRQYMNRGIGEDVLLANTGLELPALWSQGKVEINSFKQLLLNAGNLNPPIPLGFMIGQHHSMMALGPVGVAMEAAPSLREGLQILDSFTRLHASYIRVEISSGLRGMSLRLYFLEELGETLRPHLEASLMFIENYVETITGRSLDDAVYKVAYPAPEYSAAYSYYLHSPVEFNQSVHSIEIPAHWLDTPSPYFHEGLWHQSLRQLSSLIKEQGKVDSSVYSNHLRALLKGCPPPLPAVAIMAQRLHVSIRTLNRRLALEGSSFREIRNEVLDQWACQHLLETASSVEAIAVALGYQDAANFRRAFKARIGMTPSEFRATR